jgi:hypothetical protein
MEATILQYYKQYSYPSAPVLYKILKNNGEAVTLKQVKETIDKQVINQTQKKVKSKISSHIVAFHEFEIVLADLIDLSMYSTTNKNYKWLLVVEDVFTRKAYGYMLKNKLANTVLDAFKLFVEEYQFPNELITDNGSEFISTVFQDYIRGKLFHKLVEVDYHKTLGMIDRLCRTLKEKLFKYFYAENTTNWIDQINHIISNYNNTPHRSLEYITPNQVEKNEAHVKQLNRDKLVGIKESTHKFAVGQLVRYKLKKTVFDKGYKKIWSTDYFTIESINGVNAVLSNGQSYKLSNLQIISKPDEIVNEIEKPVDEIHRVEKIHKTKKYLQKEGVDETNILPTRTRSKK